MHFNEDMDQLSQLCKGKDWFFDIGTDNFGNYVVYANFMNKEVLTAVPDVMGDRRVLLHFAASKKASKEQFTETHKWSWVQPSPSSETSDLVSDIVGSDKEEKSIRHLQDELGQLEKKCGSNILGDIFFEIHDKENAVTNLSAKYPEVRKPLEKLYHEYGFDVMYEELEL